MNTRPQRQIAAVALALLAGISALWGIGMRHDVNDLTYCQFGQNEGEFTPGESYPDLSGVVSIGIPTTDPAVPFSVYGSGTLIGSRWIATAAHVVLEPEHAQTLVQGLVVRFGPDAGDGFEEVQIRRIYVPLNVEKLAPLGEKGNYKESVRYVADLNDFALLELMDPVAGYAVTPIARQEPQSILYQRAVISGFGESGYGNDPDERRWIPSRRRRAAENTIDRVITAHPITGVTMGGLIAMDFDSGEEKHNTLNGSTKSWEDLIREGPSSAAPLPIEGACYPGDSGGPAFIRQDDEWRLVGVAGYGFGFPPQRRRNKIQYGDTLIYTLVPAQTVWIKSIMQEDLKLPAPKENR